jgi:uncharacterized protein YjbI with pentapeptide repeats
MTKPRQLESPLYLLLHNEDIEGFNTQRTQGGDLDFTDGDFRGLDLRLIDADGVNFTNGYFRGADLRGVDLRTTRMDGASIAHAQISGAYFPIELSADEIVMSLTYGTRMRYRPQGN